MKKSERLNDMIIYLKDKDYFNLSDLMKTYHISKSTALRDVQSLEAIGMPIFSEQGRYGRYGILKNRLLTPIYFTVDETYALYFAMLTLRDYQSTPFNIELSRLKTKFEACISKELKTNLNKMESVISFASSKQVIDSPFLKEILVATLSDSVHDISYMGAKKPQTYTVQFLKISSSFGQWYVTAYNYNKEKLQIFRCDKIVNLFKKNEDKFPIGELKKAMLFNDSFKTEHATNFEVSITNKGVDIFLKENYPSMSLKYFDGKGIIEGYYNQDEEQFISNYFMSYGKEILSIKPERLKNLIITKMEQNLDHLRNS